MPWPLQRLQRLWVLFAPVLVLPVGEQRERMEQWWRVRQQRKAGRGQECQTCLSLLTHGSRKGRLESVVSARDRFIREAVLQQGYLASQVASFLNGHPSNISRALQKT